MSYKTNSPVKQVWLPIDSTWLGEVIGGTNTFGNFSKAYKERYGIDLHDLFELKIKGSVFYLCTKIDLIGSYLVNDLFLRFARYNGVEINTTGNSQEPTPVVFLIVSCTDLAKQAFGYGFNIVLPVQATPVNSIDDLEVTLYEI